MNRNQAIINEKTNMDKPWILFFFSINNHFTVSLKNTHNSNRGEKNQTILIETENFFKPLLCFRDLYKNKKSNSLVIQVQEPIW